MERLSPDLALTLFPGASFVSGSGGEREADAGGEHRRRGRTRGVLRCLSRIARREETRGPGRIHGRATVFPGVWTDAGEQAS